MTVCIVVDRLGDLRIDLPDATVIDTWQYLTDSSLASRRRLKVYNLCGSYRYQSAGYYVSLLAAARGHHVLPEISVIQDFKQALLPRWLSEDLEAQIERSLKSIEGDRFTLSVYFGQNLAKRHAALARNLFNLLPAPLLRAEFERDDGEWRVRQVRPIALGEVPETHRDFLREAAKAHFTGRYRAPRTKPARFSLAVLHNPDEADAPSNAQALKKFEKAATRIGFEVELIRRDDFGRLAEFDALFIRETTAVNHHTYRFARRAAREDLVVIDDPESILRCTNKVYLAELLAARKIAAPRTIIAHRGNVERLGAELGFPLVLKLPDSAFSVGVIKVDDRPSLKAAVEKFFRRSDLIVAQAFTPTDFDWRVGVLDGQPLFVCRYYMARKHWQIIDRDGKGKAIAGDADTLPVEEAPPAVVKTAVAAATAIGRGFYGVDLKQIGDKVQVMEVNDNPNLDAGVEDRVLGDALYQRIAEHFMARVEERARVEGNGSP